MPLQEITVLDWNLAHAFKYQSRYLPRLALPVQIKLDVPSEVAQLIIKDPLLQQQIIDACQQTLEESAKKLINLGRKSIT